MYSTATASQITLTPADTAKLTSGSATLFHMGTIEYTGGATEFCVQFVRVPVAPVLCRNHNGPKRLSFTERAEAIAARIWNAVTK